MATLTKADLTKRVLQNLRVLGASATPTADDSDVIGEKLDHVHARLQGRGLTNDGTGAWTIETVPDFVAESYIVMASSLAADPFHVPDDRIVRLRLEAVEAENEIRRQVATLNDGEPAKAEQF